jgi:hypothetical protein
MGRLLLTIRPMKKMLIIFFVAIVGKTGAQVPCDKIGLLKPEQLLAMLQYKPVNIEPMRFVAECNVTDTIRKRLAYLLNWRWTPAEIEGYFNQELELHKSFYRIEAKAAAVANGNQKQYKKAIDSITKEVNAYTLKYMQKGGLFAVREVNVLVVGWLIMKETIPFLRDSAMQDQAHYPRWAVELALARMGDISLQTKIIDECRNLAKPGADFEQEYIDKSRKLKYLGTQESLCQLNQFIDTSKYVEENSNGAKTSFARRVAIDLQIYIKNAELKRLIDLIGDEYNYSLSAIMDVKRWMIANKGKYIIKTGICPY